MATPSRFSWVSEKRRQNRSGTKQWVCRAAGHGPPLVIVGLFRGRKSGSMQGLPQGEGSWPHPKGCPLVSHRSTWLEAATMTLFAAGSHAFPVRNIKPFVPLLVYVAVAFLVAATYVYSFSQIEKLIQQEKLHDLGAIAHMKAAHIG